MGPRVANYFARLRSIRGWFSDEDFRLFDFLLSSQDSGDLVEIGAYEGASAILLGLHARAGETFTVCDLFGASAENVANRVESEAYYGGLTREQFERNYLGVLPELPVIVQRSSLEILDFVAAGSCRFVHVDGSHLYEYVRSDLRASRTMLAPNGVVAVDDWRWEHTPGVMLALMEMVAARELHAIAITPAKFYGSFSDDIAAARREAVANWARAHDDLEMHLTRVRDEDWPRVTSRPQPPQRRSLLRRIVTRLH